MNVWMLLLIFGIGLVVVYAAGRAMYVYLHLLGKRLVVCPETQEYAAVELDAAKAAAKSLEGKTWMRLKNCNRWAERDRCAEPCLKQIVEAPDGCLVTAYVDNFYHDKRCAICNKRFIDVGWTDRLPAALDDDGKTVRWDELRVERLPKFLDNHLPVCWDCHVAETFRREHKEMVTDRPAH